MTTSGSRRAGFDVGSWSERARSRFTSPSELVWIPTRLDYAPEDATPWLPTAAREVRTHEIFARCPAKPGYVYCGRAHLGSWGGRPDVGDVSASFSLGERLARRIWLSLGGYSGWMFHLQHEPMEVAAGDREPLGRLLDDLATHTQGHLQMTRYEQDSLDVFTNPERAWLMYLRTPDCSGVYLDPASTAAHPDEVFRCGCGIEVEHPRRETTSHAEARAIVEAFFRTGELPRSHRWSD